MLQIEKEKIVCLFSAGFPQKTGPGKLTRPKNRYL